MSEDEKKRSDVLEHSYIYEVSANLSLTDFVDSSSTKEIKYRTFVSVPQNDLDDSDGFQKREAVLSFWNHLLNHKSFTPSEIAAVTITGIERGQRIDHFEITDSQPTDS